MMKTAVPPPRHTWAFPLVVTAVLSLAFAGAAHALSVDIIIPKTDPYEVRQYQRRYFEAVCHDARGNDVTEMAAFSWDFGDGTKPDPNNPAVHQWLSTGKYRVTVTAVLGDARTGESLGTDTVTVEVTPGVQTRQAPGAGDFSFYATPVEDRSYTFGSTVCDAVTVICRASDPGTSPYDPWDILAIEFEEFVDGSWESVSGTWEMIEVGGEEYEGKTADWQTFDGPKNIAYAWRAKVTMHDTNFPPDPEFFPEAFSDFYVPDGEGTDWTPENTIVKAAGDDIILHHADDTSHTISWNITHLDYDTPTFTVDVEIWALSGGVITTLTDEDASLGAGSIDWDTDLPQDSGIYTYRITAEHNLSGEQGPPGLCVDIDKSEELAVTGTTLYYCSRDVEAGQLRGVVKYGLNRAAGAVTLRFFDADLEEFTESVLTGQDHAEGDNWSDVYTLDDVDFDQNGDPVGPIYCVVYAEETGVDAAQNRDEYPKPALQRGTATLQELLNLSAATLIDPPLDEHEEEDPGAFVHYNIDNDDWSNPAVGGSKHPGCDLLQQEDAVSDEDDLLPVTVTFDTTIHWGKVALVRSDESILVWTSATKGDDHALLVEEQEAEEVWDLSVPAEYAAFHALKSSLFVEGAEYNGGADLKLQFLTPDDTLICEDVVHYTAIAADCGDQPPTAEDRERFEDNAPNLMACEWSSLPMPTGAHWLNFNCIAWSVGRPEVWVNRTGDVYLERIETDGNPLTEEWRLVVSIDLVWGDQNGQLSEADIDRFYANDPKFYKGDENPEDDPPWERNPWEFFAGVTDPATFTRLVGEDATPANADVMYYSGYHGAESWQRACVCGAGQWLMFRSKVGDGALIEHLHDGVNGMQPPGTGEDYGTPCYYYEEAE